MPSHDSKPTWPIPQARPQPLRRRLHDQQTARGGHEFILANGVIHIRHHDAVSRDDRPTENGGAQVQYQRSSSGTSAIIVNRAAVAVSAAAMMTKRRSKRSESQPIGQARRNPPSPGLELRPESERSAPERTRE